MAALTQSDVDKLKRAIASGVRTVQYAAGSVSYQTTEEMLRALTFAENDLRASSDQATPSALAVFGRD